MKILVFSQNFWPETFAINGLTSMLRERGAEVIVLTGQPNYPEGKIFPGYAAWSTKRERFGEIEVVRVPLFPRGRGSSWRLALNYVSFIVSAALFGPLLLRSRSFDAIFVYATSPLLQALPAVWLARLRRVPLVVWVQDLWPESLSATGFIKNSHVLAAVSVVVRFIYRCCDAVLIQSRAFRGPVEQLIDNPQKIHYYPNTFSPQTEATPSPHAIAAAQQIRQNFSIVFAGNLGTAQSLETVVEAAERLQEQSDIRFCFIGSGSRDEWLKDEIVRRGLKNIAMLGRFAPQDMSTIFSSAAALLATLKDEPIFAYTVPSKIQAYLAEGRPIVVALNGEGARIVEEAGAGVACPAGDAEGLANAVLKLYKMTAADREALGVAGRAYFMKHFESGKLTSELLELLRTTMQQGEKR